MSATTTVQPQISLDAAGFSEILKLVKERREKLMSEIPLTLDTYIYLRRINNINDQCQSFLLTVFKEQLEQWLQHGDVESISKATFQRVLESSIR